MFKFFLVLFILLPLAELYLLIEVGAGIGGFSTIALCLLTAALGGILVRHQGMRTLVQAKELMDRGQPPAEQMLHGMMIAISGVLLFIPGFITDIIGFLLLVPPVRNRLGQRLISAQLSNQRAGGETVIDAEVIHPDRHHLP
ncbi:MAG: FxsA family protein [Mariprofundaceae bacterium]|nr:FxsA family protein [Mariprofundaceae bacterium]